MRKLRLLVLSAALAFSVVGTVATPAHACTSPIRPDGCAVINRICHCLG